MQRGGETEAQREGDRDEGRGRETGGGRQGGKWTPREGEKRNPNKIFKNKNKLKRALNRSLTARNNSLGRLLPGITLLAHCQLYVM